MTGPLFPRNRNDLGGVRAPYCFLAAWFLWLPVTGIIFTASPAAALGFFCAWGGWLFLGWRRGGGERL